MTTETTRPALEGTPKQVAWAEEIRAKMLGEVDRSLAAIGRQMEAARAGEPRADRLGRPLEPIRLEETADWAWAMLSGAAEFLAGVTDASWWIDRRTARSWGLMLDHCTESHGGQDEAARDRVADAICDLTTEMSF